MNASEKFIWLFGLDKRGKTTEFANEVNKSPQHINNLKSYKGEKPSQIMIEIVMDKLDGKEGRKLINMNWFMNDIGDPFMDIEGNPTPEPPKSDPNNDNLTLESLKDLMLERFSKMEHKFEELKSSQFKADMIASGMGVEIQAIKENMNLGKHNTNTKVSKNKPNVVGYYPNEVNNLSKLG